MHTIINSSKQQAAKESYTPVLSHSISLFCFSMQCAHCAQIECKAEEMRTSFLFCPSKNLLFVDMKFNKKERNPKKLKYLKIHE